MRCPFCAALDTRVIDSRLGSDGNQIRRRRACSKCGERFTTYESVELNLPQIIKSDNRREAFSEEKLRRGIFTAIEKRPVAVNEVDATVSRIMHQLRAIGEREVDSMQLGSWVMDCLREIDQVAYVRFASVYRDFKDVGAFIDEIERLEQELPVSVKKKPV